jgi:hypothetical protein
VFGFNVKSAGVAIADLWIVAFGFEKRLSNGIPETVAPSGDSFGRGHVRERVGVLGERQCGQFSAGREVKNGVAVGLDFGRDFFPLGQRVVCDSSRLSADGIFDTRVRVSRLNRTG